MKQIEDILSFVVEIEKLKSINRKTKPVGLDRFENSAEHSWHICLTALMLKDYANESIDINRVIQMLLIHDLGEIDAGDTIIYASQNSKVKDEDAAGVKRILDMLPKEKADEYFDLWHEFEAGKTADAAYAKAIDRVPPLLHNLHGNGHSWKTHQVSKEMVFDLNGKHISKGSTALWSVMESKLEKAVDDGLLE